MWPRPACHKTLQRLSIRANLQAQVQAWVSEQTQHAEPSISTCLYMTPHPVPWICELVESNVTLIFLPATCALCIGVSVVDLLFAVLLTTLLPCTSTQPFIFPLSYTAHPELELVSGTPRPLCPALWPYSPLSPQTKNTKICSVGDFRMKWGAKCCLRLTSYLCSWAWWETHNR